MIKLVQDEQKQVSVILAVFIEERLVEQQPGSRTTFHAGGLCHLAELDIEQPKELLHLIGRRGQDVEDAFPDGRCLRS